MNPKDKNPLDTTNDTKYNVYMEATNQEREFGDLPCETDDIED